MEDFDMNKLAMISQFMGSEVDMPTIIEMAEKAKVISSMMELEQTKNQEILPIIAEEKSIENESLTTRQINALSAAIPFLNEEYQKGLYIVVKFLEINNFNSRRGIVALEKKEPDWEKRRISMLNAIEKTLNTEERNNFATFMKLLKASSFF